MRDAKFTFDVEIVGERVTRTHSEGEKEEGNAWRVISCVKIWCDCWKQNWQRKTWPHWYLPMSAEDTMYTTIYIHNTSFWRWKVQKIRASIIELSHICDDVMVPFNVGHYLQNKKRRRRRKVQFEHFIWFQVSSGIFISFHFLHFGFSFLLLLLLLNRYFYCSATFPMKHLYFFLNARASVNGNKTK